jgi:hypothetical protein
MGPLGLCPQWAAELSGSSWPTADRPLLGVGTAEPDVLLRLVAVGGQEGKGCRNADQTGVNNPEIISPFSRGSLLVAHTS